MDECLGLVLYDSGNCGIGMSKRIDCDTCREVQICSVFVVIEYAAFALHHHWRRSNIGRHHVRSRLFEEGGCGRV